MQRHGLESHSSMALCSQAERLMDVGRSAEAIGLLQQAIRADPQDVRTRCLLALALLRLHKLSLALKSAEEAVRLDPAQEWPHRLRSIILRQMGKHRRALEAAREAARLAPYLPATLDTLTRSLVANGRRAEARSTAERLVAAAPDLALSHTTFGWVALHERRWKEAEEHYRRALQLEPESWEALNNLGVVLQRQGKKKAAIERFRDAAQLDPAHEVSRKNLFQSVGGYIGVRFIVVWVVFQLLRGVLTGLPPQARAQAGVPLFALFVLVAIGCFLWRNRRLAELHPTVTAFYQEEKRREWARLKRELPAMIGLSFGTLITIFWNMVWLLEGAASAGLRSWAVIPYLLVTGGTIAGCGAAVRKRWKARRSRR